jgi:thiamine biosynthesis lipoprotein
MESGLKKLEFRDDYWLGHFQAMASPCEVLMDTTEQSVAQKLLEIVEAEARRIETKFSRYRDDNIIYQINHSHGQPVEVDEETAALLDYANQCYEISEGMFDITSGVLREVWRFDGSANVPSEKTVSDLLPRIGWDKVTWRRPYITLPKGMEIDLGGIGKEYAVDKTALLLDQQGISALVNFGGDLYVNRARNDGRAWVVGIENPTNLFSKKFRPGSKLAKHSVNEFELERGGIATSGDTRRYLLKDGIRYSHILDPRTGWPVKQAPHSVTVAAATCTDAGIIATLAMLHGKNAEAFLKAQSVKFWCYR